MIFLTQTLKRSNLNPYIAISQTARIMAVWAKKTTTKQILLTVSIIAYTALLMEREKKISKYYERSTEDSSKQGSGNRDR